MNAKTIKPDFTLSVADSGGQADQTVDDGAIIKITGAHNSIADLPVKMRTTGVGRFVSPDVRGSAAWRRSYS